MSKLGKRRKERAFQTEETPYKRSLGQQGTLQTRRRENTIFWFRHNAEREQGMVQVLYWARLRSSWWTMSKNFCFYSKPIRIACKDFKQRNEFIQFNFENCFWITEWKMDSWAT